jgi:hypothetical protein
MSNQVNTDISIVKIPVLKGMVRSALKHKHPIMVWGAPGTGKSQCIRQVAEEEGIGFIDFRLGQIDAVDIRGIPYVIELPDGSRAMSFAPTTMLPREGRGILFFDELPQAPTLVQNAASEILLDRRCGEYRLPDGWIVIAAGNRKGDRAATLDMPSHIKNRLIHVELTHDARQWVQWARDNSIHSQVIAFIENFPNLLYSFDPKKTDITAYPTLRTWEFVSDIVYSSPDKESLKASVYGAVGKQAAVQFLQFINDDRRLTIEDIYKDPLGCEIPDDYSQMWEQLNMIASEILSSNGEDALTKLVGHIKRYPKDAVAALIMTINSTNPERCTSPAFKELFDYSGVASG